MKNNDIKKGYENIQISAAEKAKIFNNIMEKKEKKNVWLPVLGFGALALASFGFLLMTNHNGGNEGNTYTLNSSLNLETNYRKEVLLNAKHYLQANNIDITELNDGESKEIDTTKVVSGDVYKSCSGKLVITKYAQDYTYSTNVTCDSSTGTNVDFKIVEGKFEGAFKTKDGIIIASAVDMEEIVQSRYKNNIALTMFDDEGNIKWHTKVMGANNDIVNNATLYVTDIQEVGNYYIGILTNTNYYDINSKTDYKQGDFSTKFVITKDGEVYDDMDLITAAPSTVGEYIGTKGDKVYFRGYTEPLPTETNSDQYIIGERECVYELTEFGSRIIRVAEKFDYLRNIGLVNVNSMVVVDGYIYGNVIVEPFYQSPEYFKNILYKMDLNGNLIDTTEIKYNGKNGMTNLIAASDDKIYLSYDVDQMRRILIYNNKLSYVGEIDFTDEIPENKSYFVEKFEVINNILNVHLTTEGSTDALDNITIRYDENGKLIDKADVVYNKDVTDRFVASSIYETDIINGKVVQIYTTSTKNNAGPYFDQVLLAYYK